MAEASMCADTAERTAVMFMDIPEDVGYRPRRCRPYSKISETLVAATAFP